MGNKPERALEWEKKVTSDPCQYLSNEKFITLSVWILDHHNILPQTPQNTFEVPFYRRQKVFFLPH